MGMNRRCVKSKNFLSKIIYLTRKILISMGHDLLWSLRACVFSLCHLVFGQHKFYHFNVYVYICVNRYIRIEIVKFIKHCRSFRICIFVKRHPFGPIPSVDRLLSHGISSG